MQFPDALSYLLDLRRFGSRPGTAATRAVLEHLDNPQQAFDCVQIAGSNGKGSTARMLAAILQEAGLSVGLYTSPHLQDLRERIQVDGRPVRKRAVVEFVEVASDHINTAASTGTAPTFFETLTALALWEFGRQNVDVAILEVGIGGKHDATSVVDPIASAVTTVTLEHTDILGEAVETIASDMAAVEPADRPLVTGAVGDALETIRDVATDPYLVGATNGPAYAPTDGHQGESSGPDGSASGGTAGNVPSGTSSATAASAAESVDYDLFVTYHGREGLEGRLSLSGDIDLETRVALLGPHQARNAAVAVALAAQVGDHFELELAGAYRPGLRAAHWPGRFEVIERDPSVILDGAHNPDAARCVTSTLAEFDCSSVHLVVGAMTDKDHAGIARELSMAETVYACQAGHDRAEDTDVIARVFERETDSTVTRTASVSEATTQALEQAGPGDCVLVTGSLAVVREARRQFTRTVVPHTVETTGEAHRLVRSFGSSAVEHETLPANAVHEIRRTTASPDVARTLRELMQSLGGTCQITEYGPHRDEQVELLLMGTLAQFDRLCDHLESRSGAVTTLGFDIRRSLRNSRDQSDQPRTDFPWTNGTAVMGVLNVTPDSFHDGGTFDTVAAAVDRARTMQRQGAAIVDIGGESTRPGAEPVSVETELDRVVPVIERLRDEDVMLSVDTRRAETARAALDAGADMINDVSGLSDPDMRYVGAEYDVPLVVMHSIETPVDPSRDVAYDDVVDDCIQDLAARIERVTEVGLDPEQIIIDPGLGFGKSATESFELLARLDEFRALGCPILAGHSHKSMFEHVGRSADDRFDSTVAATAMATRAGADIVRVHDVDANVAAVDVAEAVEAARRNR